MNLYESVKASVSVPAAAERYGLSPGRTGMVRCPFHDDHTPSLKLYPGNYHCFGCGAHGDVVNLVAGLLGLSNYDAAKQIAADFGLQGPPPGNALRLPPKPQDCASVLENRLCQLREWKRTCAPKTPEEELDPRFVTACRELDYTEYLAEILTKEKQEEYRGKESKTA